MRRSAAPPAAPAETAEERTRRIFPECFQGKWPDPARTPGQIPAHHPETYLVLPRRGQVPEPFRRGDPEGLAEDIARFIEEQGAVNLSPDVLRSAVGITYDQAFDEAHLRFQQQLNGEAPAWEALFHDDHAPGPNGTFRIRAGDKKKTMSPPLGPDSMIVQCMNKALQVLKPGYKVAVDPDGGQHMVLIHHNSDGLFSGEHYVQAFHADMLLHGSGRCFSNRTLSACLRDDGPLVFWLSFSETPVGLAFLKRSHHVARFAGQFYIHYAPLWAEYYRTHPGSTEDDFKRLWDVLVLQHVQEECERFGIQVEPEAILNMVQPGGGAMWHCLTVHGGTSQGGLRAFAIAQKDVDQGVVELPEKSIDNINGSRVLAGGMQLYKPLNVALTNKHGSEQIAEIIAGNRRGLRAASRELEAAVLHVLDEERSSLGVRLEPAHHKVTAPKVAPKAPKVAVPIITAKTTGFGHLPSLIGVVCSIREPEGGAPGKGKVLLWLEHNEASQDRTRATLVRNAAFTSAMNRLQTRRVSSPETVCSLVQPRTPVKTFGFGDFFLLCSPVSIDSAGELLRDRVARVLVPWNEFRELTEPLRDTLSELLKTVDRLENDGFRMVVFDLGLFYVTGDGRVILVFSGGGFLGPKKRALCDRNQTQEVTAKPMLRRNTSTYLPEFLKSQEVRADLNMRRLQDEARGHHEREALAANENADAADVAPTLREWSDSDLRNWHSAQRGRPMGVFGRGEGELNLVDESLTEDLDHFKGTTDAVMDLLRLTDIHQIMVWLVCTLREASKPGESFCARRQLLSNVLGKDTMEESFESMELFIYGRCTERTTEGRAAADYKTCKQPAAFRRLLEAVVFGMHDVYRERAAEGVSNMLFFSTVVYSPHDERLLSEGGIRLEVQLYPFDDPDFRQKVDAMLTKRKAKGRDKFPRTVLLRNEGEFGVGAHGPGAYEQGDFLGFYLGVSLRKDEDPHGRYVVTSLGKDPKYCDGFGVPASEHRRRGTFGSCMNSSWNREAEPPGTGKLQPNVTVDRDHQLQHTSEGRKLTLIPIFALHKFSDKPLHWDYDPGAGHGRSFN